MYPGLSENAKRALQGMSRRRLAVSVLAVALLAGCAAAPQAPPEAEPKPETPPPPAEAPAQAPPAPVVVTPAGKAQAQKLALQAAELLEEGNLDEAGARLREALSLDPGNRIANSLSKQLSADPAAVLGAESFNYTVRQGDTLSKIAGRFLGDIYQFHILARYNDIRVPRQVQVGQVIRVPGKAPPPAAATEPVPKPAPPPKRTAEEKPAEGRKLRPGEPSATEKARPVSPTPDVQPAPVSPGEQAYQAGLAALKAGDKAKAYAAFEQAIRLDPEHKDAKAKAAQTRQDLIQSYHRNATAAFHRQDMDTAIRQWDKVLELDPGNETAKLNRQRAVDLSERYRQIR